MSLEIMVAVEGLRALVAFEWPVVLSCYIRVTICRHGRDMIRRREEMVSQAGMRVVVVMRDYNSSVRGEVVYCDGLECG